MTMQAPGAAATFLNVLESRLLYLSISKAERDLATWVAARGEVQTILTMVSNELEHGNPLQERLHRLFELSEAL